MMVWNWLKPVLFGMLFRKPFGKRYSLAQDGIIFAEYWWNTTGDEVTCWLEFTEPDIHPPPDPTPPNCTFEEANRTIQGRVDAMENKKS
jgi:hypothetical protein